MPKVSIYNVIDSVRKPLDTPWNTCSYYSYDDEVIQYAIRDTSDNIFTCLVHLASHGKMISEL